MAKKDYAAMADGVIKAVGGEGNIANVTHCMTRLRLQLVDNSKLNEEEAKKVPGVMNLIVQNGEYQFVIGQDVPSLYEEMVKHDGIKAGGSVDDIEAAKSDNKKKGKIIDAIFSFIGGTFSPCIPVLVAGGLTGAVLTLLTNFCGVTADSGTYQVFYAINQAAFYFLPIFVGFAAASRLKCNGYLGAFLAAILLYSGINGVEGLDFFGLKIQAISYNANIFPIILGVLFMSVIYKFLQKHMPVYLKTIVVPLLTMLITVPVTLLILGPIGNTVGTWLCDGLLALYRTVPALSVAIVGACLAAALIAKNAEEKSVAAGAGITAMCGITEPGVYGVLFVKKYPLIGAMIGGGIGGFIAGLLGMTQYVVSTPGFISFAAYITPAEQGGGSKNFIIAMAVMVIAVIISFVSTYLLGKRQLAKEAKAAK